MLAITPLSYAEEAKPAAKPEEKKPDAKPEEAKPADRKDRKKNITISSGDYAYINMDPVTTPVIDPKKVQKFSTYLIVLEVPKESVSKVSDKLPQLHDAFLSYMFRLNQFQMTDQLNDMDFIKDELKTVAYEIVPKEYLHDLLITGAQDRKF